MSTVDLVLHRTDDEHAIASYGRFVVVIWRGMPTRARMEGGLEVVNAVYSAVGASLGMLAVMEEGSPPPLSVDLEWVKIGAAAVPGMIAGMAGVFESRDGAPPDHDAGEVMAAGLGSRIPMRVCFDVDEACTWLARRVTPDSADASARRMLARAVETTRAAVVASSRF